MGNFFGDNTNEKKHNHQNSSYTCSHDCLDVCNDSTDKYITCSGHKVVYIYSIIHSIINRYIFRFDRKLVFGDFDYWVEISDITTYVDKYINLWPFDFGIIDSYTGSNRNTYIPIPYGPI